MALFESPTQKKQKHVHALMAHVLNNVSVQAPDLGEGDRDEHRRPVVLAIYLVPILDDATYDVAAAFSAATRDVTLSGLSFVHRRIFQPDDRLVVTISGAGKTSHFLSEVRYCREIGLGIYITGVHLTEAVDHRPEFDY